MLENNDLNLEKSDAPAKLADEQMEKVTGGAFSEEHYVSMEFDDSGYEMITLWKCTHPDTNGENQQINFDCDKAVCPYYEPKDSEVVFECCATCKYFMRLFFPAN